MNDPHSESRKKDHINLAFNSQLDRAELDRRFYYDPILKGHPSEKDTLDQTFLGFNFRLPIWVSSMTGGTEMASTINKNLAKACGEYGMGMGLGSCRSLLEDQSRLSDFDVKKYMEDQPLFANLGIAQVEEIVHEKSWSKLENLIKILSVDGLIIHINPLQEWLQPEGDRYYASPLDTIKRLIDRFPDQRLIVKEVGQGMGYESLKALYQLPLAAVDFAAAGGTNFSLLELARNHTSRVKALEPFANIGHDPIDMVHITNQVFQDLSNDRLCEDTIISGGVKTYLDGYYLTQKLQGNAIYGQASAFLKPALESYEVLQKFVDSQREGLILAHQFLSIR